MKLNRLTERVWIWPYEAERDRPNLGYIRGDRWSLAVDAGHSDAHVAEFYRALEDAGLPLPRLTAITHWHWDHTFGMHAVHGLCVAGARTGARLAAFRDRMAANGTGEFLALDESVRREYAGGRPVVITLPDLTFDGEMRLDPGGCAVRLLAAESPHTDDSTLVFAEGERVLFMGDSAAGVFPTWEKDPALCRKLADTVAGLDAGICLESHWEPQTKAELIKGLLEA